jgi:anti-sigma regulatory factor (Ser/Thr protein kinase)
VRGSSIAVSAQSPTSVTPVKKAAAVSAFRMSLPQRAASPAEARHQVARFAVENQLLAEPAVALVVLSELVTNAVLHGAEPIEVCVRGEDGGLRIEVSDGGAQSAPMVPQAQRPDRPGGLGLHIVDALARRWGTDVREDGKTVWAEIGADPECDL